MEDLSIPQELLDEAGDLFSGGFNLKVPKEAEEKRKKGRVRFTEHVVVENAYREVRTSQTSGEEYTLYEMKTRVLPREGGANTGRMFFVRNRYNYKAMAEMARLKEAGQLDMENLSGQQTMSLGAIRKVKGLLIAAEVPIEETGLSHEILNAFFPLKDSFEVEGGDTVVSPLIEKRFIVSISDNANSTWNDENNQEAESFQMITEEE